MVRARVVLPLGEVDARLPAVGGVDLGHERGGDLHVADAALVHRRAEAGEVAHHAAAHRGDQVVAADARERHRPQDLLGLRERLVPLAGRDRMAPVGCDAVRGGHVLVGDREAAAPGRPEEAAREQAAAEEDRVLPASAARPCHPRARRRLAQSEERRERTHRDPAVGRRE